MAVRFEDGPLVEALDRSLRNAKHLRARDAAAVAAARALARKIDAWDVIVEWALEDSRGEGRPKVPANDNELRRSEERFSRNAETELVCRLLLEKKKGTTVGT